MIFSGLLDALVCALRELQNVILDSLPRMADAALWATAGESAFGWERGTVLMGLWFLVIIVAQTAKYELSMSL